MSDAKRSESGGNIPAGIHKGLNDAMFADSASIVLGSVLTTVAAIACWAPGQGFGPLAIGLATALVTILRLGVAKARNRLAKRDPTADLSWHDRVFLFGGVVYLLCNGALVIWAFGSPHDEYTLTLVLMMGFVNALSIAIRSFAVARYAKYQAIAIIFPLFVAFAQRGGSFWQIAAAQLLLLAFILSSAARLRNILLSEMSYRRSSDIVAERFNFAVQNMSHGMCMIDRDMRIVVSNQKLAQYFGFRQKRSLNGANFTALVRMARRNGSMTGKSAADILAAFRRSGAADRVISTEIEGANGSVYDLSLRSHSAGGWVLVVQDVTEQRRAREALDVAARFDPVTRLPNRRSFEEHLSEALEQSKESQRRVEVLFLDLDGFKQINDTLGHKVGDRVLMESGARLLQITGQGEYVSRWGGDEFVILRFGEDDAAVRRFADDVIRELSRPTFVDGAQVVVGASVGIAACVAGEVGMDALLQQADMALYAAKRESRGHSRLYETSMSAKAQDRRLLELDLQAALAARAFELHYQPIVDLETGDLVSFEALARWRHPTRGDVSPSEFVPVLEDLNLMHAFGAWAMQRACEDASRWPIPVRVGVNVSTRQVDTLVDTVRRVLASTGLAPGRLEIEITETAALAAGDTVCTTLEQLRSLGVRIALDDFGTGFSSLSHLMRLPLDKVKIDKSFTQQLGANRKADVLVANIARLSSQLGMRVTFEGVETTDQLERARAVGVSSEGQGWLFGKAVLNSELARIFAIEGERAVA